MLNSQDGAQSITTKQPETNATIDGAEGTLSATATMAGTINSPFPVKSGNRAASAANSRAQEEERR